MGNSGQEKGLFHSRVRRDVLIAWREGSGAAGPPVKRVTCVGD